MKKFVRRMLVVLFYAAMAMGIFSLTAAAATLEPPAADSVENLVLGEPVHVQVEYGEEERFTFTPKEDGWYMISTSNAASDPYGYLYDGDFKTRLAELDERDYTLRELKGGTTIGIVLGDRNGGSFDLTVSHAPKIVLNGSGGATAKDNASAITVAFVPGSTLDSITLDSPSFYKEGYLQVGWSRTPNGEVLDQSNLVYPENGQTYYAVWEKGVFVTFDPKQLNAIVPCSYL